MGVGNYGVLGNFRSELLVKVRRIDRAGLFESDIQLLDRGCLKNKRSVLRRA